MSNQDFIDKIRARLNGEATKQRLLVLFATGTAAFFWLDLALKVRVRLFLRLDKRGRVDATIIKNKASGKSLFIVDGWVCTAPNTVKEGKFGLLTDSLKAYGARGQATAIAQFYGLVIPGLILTKHIFEGLDRPLFCDGEKTGDRAKLVHARKPGWDFMWSGDHNGSHQRVLAPADAVFVVIISPNEKHRGQFPEVDGWIERWNWVGEDPVLSEAPVGWIDRYGKKLWTKE